MALSPKEEDFVKHLASGMSQADAFRAAYPHSLKWKPAVLHVRACELAAKSKVKVRLEEMRAKAAAANEITLERIVAEAAKLAFGDLRDVMEWTEGGVKLKPSDQITDAAAAAVVEISEKPGQFGSSMKVKRADKLGALRFLAELGGYLKHKTEVTGKDGAPLAPEAPKGVLIVPGVMSEDAWEAMVSKKA